MCFRDDVKPLFAVLSIGTSSTAYLMYHLRFHCLVLAILVFSNRGDNIDTNTLFVSTAEVPVYLNPRSTAFSTSGSVTATRIDLL